MNNQNILKYRGTKLEGVLDNSEFYDYELVETIDVILDYSETYDYELFNPIFEPVDAILDYSEIYDYELFNPIFEPVDIVLDYSEVYDYTIGDSKKDYIEFVPVIVTLKYIITEDEFIFSTEDNYLMEYNG